MQLVCFRVTEAVCFSTNSANILLRWLAPWTYTQVSAVPSAICHAQAGHHSPRSSLVARISFAPGSFPAHVLLAGYAGGVASTCGGCWLCVKYLIAWTNGEHRTIFSRVRGCLKQDCPESCIVGRSLRYMPVGERVGRESRAGSGLRASSAGARLCHDRLAPTRSIGTRRFIKPFLSASAIASTPVSPFLSSFSCRLPLVHPVCLSSQTASFTP